MKDKNHINHDLPDYLTGRLSEVAKLQVDRHLELCSDCREELERLHGVAATMELQRAKEPPAEYWLSILPRVKQRIQGERGGSLGRSVFLGLLRRVLAPATAVAFGVALIIYFAIFKTDSGAPEKLDDDVRTLVQDLSVSDLNSIAEPAIAPSAAMTPISESEQNRLLAGLLVQDLSLFDRSGVLYDITSTVESLSDQEVVEVLKILEGTGR